MQKELESIEEKKSPTPAMMPGPGPGYRNQRLSTFSGTTVPSAMSTSVVITVPT